MTTLRPSSEIRADIEVLERELKVSLAFEMDAARTKIETIMQAAGMTVEDLMGVTKVRKASKKMAVKYRDNNGNTWSGQGRMPAWLKDAPNPEQFRV